VGLTENIPDRQQQRDPDLAEHLSAAVAKLSPKLQVVFVMHDIEEYTHNDISAALGIPVGTSKARLHGARARLRALLSREYGRAQS
jgi:RNA polymerase sigma-70 factor (ECF subfamily)